MKKIIAVICAVLMVLPLFGVHAAGMKSNKARTTLLDTTNMRNYTYSEAEGWYYSPNGDNGNPLLTLDSYGSASAHSAPVLVPANTHIVVHGDCYIDNACMGETYNVISGSYDGYLHIDGDGSLNLYADTYQGSNIIVPGGGVNDNSECLVIDGLTVNCYNYERNSHTAFSNKPCIDVTNSVTIRNSTVNTYAGKCGIHSQGYTPIGGVSESTADVILIENSTVNITHYPPADSCGWQYAKGLESIFGRIMITGNSDVNITGGSYSIYSYLSLRIEGGRVNVVSTPVASSYEGYALVYCNDLHIEGDVEEVYFTTTKWPLTVVEYCKTEGFSSLGEGLDVLVGSFENGNFATAPDPDNNDLPALHVKKHVDEPQNLLGDVDCNGVVTMADVSLLSMYLNGENPSISEQGMINADANEDGVVDIRDISAIYYIISHS
ncbi:MAG: hypothetical protein II155_03120 [Clostridia bacterium]|nr:hypothetical protein [Clostridia bacterium]